MTAVKLPMPKQAPLFYQPQSTMKGWNIVGIECIPRYTTREFDLTNVTPIRGDECFVDTLDWSNLHCACLATLRWPEIVVAINVRPDLFKQRDFASRFLKLVSTTGANCSHLELEILEETLIDDCDAVIETMTLLSGAGIKIVIDHFGSGYANLCQLARKLPLFKLKLDSSLIGIDDLTRSRYVVEAIIALGVKLGVTVAAEGVDTDEQYKFLSDLGCDTMQGYLVSPPVSAQQVDALLHQGLPIPPRATTTTWPLPSRPCAGRAKNWHS